MLDALQHTRIYCQTMKNINKISKKRNVVQAAGITKTRLNSIVRILDTCSNRIRTVLSNIQHMHDARLENGGCIFFLFYSREVEETTSELCVRETFGHHWCCSILTFSLNFFFGCSQIPLSIWARQIFSIDFCAFTNICIQNDSQLYFFLRKTRIHWFSSGRKKPWQRL